MAAPPAEIIIRAGRYNPKTICINHKNGNNKNRVDFMPYYIPLESRTTYLRFKEALEDSESPNIDEFINELLDLKEDQDTII
jgi:hypothetical protein